MERTPWVIFGAMLAILGAGLELQAVLAAPSLLVFISSDQTSPLSNVDVVQTVIQYPKTQHGDDPDDTTHLGDSVRVGEFKGVLVNSDGVISTYFVATLRDKDSPSPDYTVALSANSVQVKWDFYYKMWRLQVNQTSEELRALPEYVE